MPQAPTNKQKQTMRDFTTVEEVSSLELTDEELEEVSAGTTHEPFVIVMRQDCASPKLYE